MILWVGNVQLNVQLLSLTKMMNQARIEHATLLALSVQAMSSYTNWTQLCLVFLNVPTSLIVMMEFRYLFIEIPPLSLVSKFVPVAIGGLRILLMAIGIALLITVPVDLDNLLITQQADRYARLFAQLRIILETTMYYPLLVLRHAHFRILEIKIILIDIVFQNVIVLTLAYNLEIGNVLKSVQLRTGEKGSS